MVLWNRSQKPLVCGDIALVETFLKFRSKIEPALFNEWVASMKPKRYLSLSLMTNSTLISNSVTLTFTSALSAR